MFKYIKTAFMNHWNLLFVGTGVAFGVLSGHPDVVGAGILAAETLYLGFVAPNERFQTYVNAQEAKVQREANAVTGEQKISRMLQKLTGDRQHRYHDLVASCNRLREVANDLKHDSEETSTFDTFQDDGLNRLLWIFLRQLYTENALARFLSHSDRDLLAKEVKKVEKKINQAAATEDTPINLKIRRTLEANLKTAKLRVENYDQSVGSNELMRLELERLENEIKSLAEIAINRQEPDYISTQIDQIVHSMHDTEKAISELKFTADFEEETVPAVMQISTPTR